MDEDEVVVFKDPKLILDIPEFLIDENVPSGQGVEEVDFLSHYLWTDLQ